MNNEQPKEVIRKFNDNLTKRLAIVDEFFDERFRQEMKWGEQNHQPEMWCCIIGEEVGEVNKAVLEIKFDNKPGDNYREELVQVGAVVMSMIECYDRNFGKEVEGE